MPRKRKEHPDRFFDIFPTRLRGIMERQRITHQEIADHLRISRQSVSAYCDGSSNPDWSAIAKIATFLGVSADYLLGLTDTPSVEPEVQAVCQYTGLTQEAVEVLHRYQAGQDGGVYDVVYDPEEAKETGNEYLKVISAFLAHGESRNLWKNATLSIKIDKQHGDPRKEALDALLEKHKLKGVQEFTSALDGYILRKDNAAKFYRQDAADSLKKIIEQLGGE